MKTYHGQEVLTVETDLFSWNDSKAIVCKRGRGDYLIYLKPANKNIVMVWGYETEGRRAKRLAKKYIKEQRGLILRKESKVWG